MPRITVSTQKYCSGPGGTRGPRSWKTKEHLFGLILIQRTRNIAVAWSDMVARSSVTRRGWWWWGGVRNAGLSYSSGTTRSRTKQSSKQPNKPALLSTVQPVSSWPSAADCCSDIWSRRAKDAVWNEMTARACVCVCVCVCVLADRTAGVL